MPNAKNSFAFLTYTFGFYVFLFFLYFWVLLAFIRPQLGSYLNVYDYYTYTYGLVALLVSIPGFYASCTYGFTRSILGKSLLLFSLALLFQFFGQLTFAYYSFYLGIDNPYPSLMEVFYFGSLPIYILAIWYLARSTGTLGSVRVFKRNWVPAILIPFIMVCLAYYLFIYGYDYSDTTPLIVFLDFGYPLLQAIQVSLAVVTYLVSAKILGGVLKKPILLTIAALVVQYIADVVYTVRTFNETWQSAGVSDLLYLISYFMMGFALYHYLVSYYKLKSTSLKTTNER
jgi:hypothetical protein